MAGLEGYSGPTSGRITLGGGREPVVERFTDPPLTADETAAVEWFTVLSPNEQLREVRRLKWDRDEAVRGRDAALVRARSAEARNGRLEAERDARRPDGYEEPRAASALLSAARRHGWATACAWTVLEEDNAGLARFEAVLGRDEWRFRLCWIVPVNGAGRGSLHRRGLARRPGRDWSDAPPLKRIHQILVAQPEELH